jgi:glycine cleavage system H protein
MGCQADRTQCKEQDMGIPADRRYSETHQWALAGNDGAVAVGITHHAQDLLGDMVFVESPAIGRRLKMGEQCGVVESVKSASDIYAPMSGAVSAVNGDLNTAPEKINEDPYEAWIFKLTPDDKSELAALLDAEAYRKLIETQA